MHGRHSPLGEYIPFLLIHVHAVGRHHVRAEEAYGVEVAHRGHGVLAQAVLHLPVGLREMYMQAQAVLAGPFGAAAKFFLSNRIYGVRGYGQLYESPARVAELLDELAFHVLNRLGMAFHNGNAYAGPHSGVAHGLDGLLYAEVHIVEEAAAAGYHFLNGKTASGGDVRVAQLVFVRPYIVLQPLLQRHIVRIAAQQRHSRVGVGVEEGREYGEAGCVDAALRYRAVAAAVTVFYRDETSLFYRYVLACPPVEDVFKQKAHFCMSSDMSLSARMPAAMPTSSSQGRFL